MLNHLRTAVTIFIAISLLGGCASKSLMKLGVMAGGGTNHLQAIGEYPKSKPLSKFLDDVSTAGINGGLTILSVSKDAGIVTMERLQNTQVMRFTGQVSEEGERFRVVLTLDFKNITTVGTLQMNAIAIFSNLQESAGVEATKVEITIDNKTQPLPAWRTEVGI